MNCSLSFIGVWGPRSETARECAERILATLRRTVLGFQLVEEWKEQVDHSPENAPAISLSLEAIEELVRDGEVRIKEKSLGFTFGAWTDESAFESVDLLCNCGSSSAAVPNHVKLNLRAKTFEQMCVDASVFLGVFGVLVESWQPDYQVCTSSDLNSILEEEFDLEQKYLDDPRVGWLFYLSDEWALGESLRDRVFEVRTLGEGNLVRVSEKPLCSSNSGDVERLLDVQALLMDSNGLR